MKRSLEMILARSSCHNDHESSQETGSESPNSPSLISSHSPKRSRRSIEKKVVNVPMKVMEGSQRNKGDTTPPSDSWSWRKYGQKPIKGSPYPRGYYRCSSTKGCPARKQVERSRDDPTMILVTYTCEHNHSWPLTSSSSRNGTKPISEPEPEPEPEPEVHFEVKEEDENNKFINLGREIETTASCVDEFAWFSEMTTTSSTILESPIFSSEKRPTSISVGATTTDDMAMFFPMGEEDESLFADLGELPECSVVFSHQSNVVGSQVEIF